MKLPQLPPESTFAYDAFDIGLSAWRRRARIGQNALGVRHVMIAVCHHFDFQHDAGHTGLRRGIERWLGEFPLLAKESRDADGAPPKQTFFYPIEQYDPHVVDDLSGFCLVSDCESEVHLPPTSGSLEAFRRTLEEGISRLASHGLLARDDCGNLRYGCIHHGLALEDIHEHNRTCTLSLLRQTGCYANFSSPSNSQRSRKQPINALHYIAGDDQPEAEIRCRQVRAERGRPSLREKGLLIVPYPLALDWNRRYFGVLPRIENGILSTTNPPTRERLGLWLDCRIAVENRPNWLFVNLHTQGIEPENTRLLLGEPMRAFYRALAHMAAADHTIGFHYVTARELVNIVHAAEAGHSGEPGQFRDFRYRRASTAPTADGPVATPPAA